jgi:hypothetical protein
MTSAFERLRMMATLHSSSAFSLSCKSHDASYDPCARLCAAVVVSGSSRTASSRDTMSGLTVPRCQHPESLNCALYLKGKRCTWTGTMISHKRHCWYLLECARRHTALSVQLVFVQM